MYKRKESLFASGSSSDSSNIPYSISLIHSSSVLPWHSSTTSQYSSDAQLVCSTAASQSTLHRAQFLTVPVTNRLLSYGSFIVYMYV